MENGASQYESIDEKKGTPDNPLVSIITQVLNGVRYLEACIQSVLNQSYPYIEHIFIDGVSTDGTVDVLSSYKAKYPDRIRFISEPDKCSAEAWNKGWKMAKGEIFGWLGADDTYEPDAIQTVVEFFKANPEAYFVFGGCNIINEKGEIIRERETRDFDLEEAINDFTATNPTSAFYKREVIEKVGFMDTSLQGTELDYWIRVGMVFSIHRIDKVLSNFRTHEKALIWKRFVDLNTATKMSLRECFIVSRRYGGSLFSRRARRYYRILIIDWLRPVLGHFYPFIRKALRK